MDGKSMSDNPETSLGDSLDRWLDAVQDEKAELEAIKWEEMQKLSPSSEMKTQGLVDPDDNNDNNYPDYYLLGC